MRGVLPRPALGRARNAQPSLADVLSLDHVTKRYDSVVAVDNVTLRVERGQFLTLLGPSGSGKTTLLMAIAGFVPLSAGSISLDAQPIDHLPPERRNFGMVFQGYALFPHLTVAENVAFPLRVRRRPRAEIEERVQRALDTVQLEGLADRLPRQLSGGQQQRAALARALVFEPSLVLLDEPLSALDKNLRSDLQLELKDLHQRVGLTFIYVTHDQQEALSLSSEIAILCDGRLVQKGKPSELYERPASRFVAGFLGRSNFLQGKVGAMASGSFAYRCGSHSLCQASSHVRVASGDSVVITVRPEKICVLADGETADNRLVGRVASWSYLGSQFHLIIDVPDIGKLFVETTTWRRETPVVGQEVVVGWDQDASIPVAED